MTERTLFIDAGPTCWAASLRGVVVGVLYWEPQQAGTIAGADFDPTADPIPDVISPAGFNYFSVNDPQNHDRIADCDEDAYSQEAIEKAMALVAGGYGEAPDAVR